MKRHSVILFIAAALISILVSACGGAAGTVDSTVGSDKPRASLVEFTGVIEAMDGDQWTVNGQALTVDPSVLRDGPFKIGDTVKIEAEVQDDGSVVVTRVEPPPAAVDPNANGNDANSNANVNSNANDNTNSSLGNSNDDNSNSNSNGNINDNSNDDNSNSNSNANFNDNSNDDNSNDDDSGGGNSNDDDHGGDDDSGSGGGDDDDD